MDVLDAQGVLPQKFDQELAQVNAWIQRADRRLDNYEALLAKHGATLS